MAQVFYDLPMNVLNNVSEVSSTVDLVFKQNTGDLSGHEALGVVPVSGGKQHVAVHAALHDSEHQVSTSLHGGVSDDVTPELHGVSKVVVLRRTLFILSVKGLEQSLSPGVSVVPVERARNREVRIGCRWVRSITNQSVDPLLISLQPRTGGAKVSLLKESNDGSGLNEVTIV